MSIGREILDAWDLKHFKRKPIADTSFQYSTREDLIATIDDRLQSCHERKPLSQHYCPDWDYGLITKDMKEWDACTCNKFSDPVPAQTCHDNVAAQADKPTPAGAAYRSWFHQTHPIYKNRELAVWMAGAEWAREQMQSLEHSSQARETKLRKMLTALISNLEYGIAMADRPGLRVPEDPAVLELCLRHGFGAVMDSASRQWVQKHGGSAMITGPCLSTANNYVKAFAALSDLERAP